MNATNVSVRSPARRRLAWLVFAATAALWVVAVVTTWLTRDLANPESLEAPAPTSS